MKTGGRNLGSCGDKEHRLIRLQCATALSDAVQGAKREQREGNGEKHESRNRSRST